MPRVAFATPDGTTGTVEESELGLMPPGTKVTGGAPPASSEVESGGLLGAAAAAALGAGSTATFGLTDKIAREGAYLAGGPSASKQVTDQLRLVRERNPGSTLAGELGGLLVNPEALSSVGEAAAAPIAARAGEGLLARAATSAARLGAESALMGAQHAVTEESLGDHDLNAQAIWSQAGKEALFGAATGAGLGFAGGLLGKARDATGSLARRSGPLSGATLDEIAGVEGAGAGVRDQAARAERTVEGLRATGATTDQAVDLVNGIDDAARARAETAPEGKGVLDWAAKQVADIHGSKDPARAEIIMRHYADNATKLEELTSNVDRRALDMTKSGNGFLRHGEDIQNQAQFLMKPDRFAKLVDTSRLDAQADFVARTMQDLDGKLSFWEGTAAKGGLEGGVKKLRALWKDANSSLLDLATGGSENTSRDLLIKMNRLKQAADSYVPFGRAAGAVVDNQAMFFGLPEATRDIADFSNTLRKGLEDEAVWGDAGAAQARENSSFSGNFERHKHFVSTFGETIDQTQGVRVPEIDYSKVRGVLDKVTGNPEIDEALQPIKSARAAIDRQRDRIDALRTSGELTESQVSKLAQAEKDVTAFESSLNGAMKEASVANRVKAARAEESNSAVGGLSGVVIDGVLRPLKTVERIAHVKHTYEKVVGSIRSGLEDFAGKSGATSTEGVAARAGAPRPREEVIKDIERTRELAGNPAALESAVSRITGDLSRYAPQTANALRLTAIRYLLHLAQNAPTPSVSSTSGFSKPVPRYSDIELHEWEAKRAAGADPRDMLTDMKHGKLNRDAIESARFVAPALFHRMQELAQEQLDHAKARGDLDKWPYQKQALMASLLDVSADDTFKPDFMLALQAARATSAPQTPPPKRGGGGGSSTPAQPPAWLQTTAQQIEGRP